MAWLTGYTHRKQITINGSTTGEQTNYQKKLTVYKGAIAKPIEEFGHIETLEGVIPVREVDDHAEGVASDGTYLYVDDKKDLRKLTKVGVLVTSNTDANLDGTDTDQINSICVNGDYLYIGADSGEEGAATASYIKVFNKGDLSFVEEHAVPHNSHFCEGCCYYKGAWWVVYYGGGETRKYNDSWEYQATYTLTGIPADRTQGVFVAGDYLVVCTCAATSPYGGTAYVYEWTGATLVARGSVEVPYAPYMQGGGKEPSKDEVWWCSYTAINTDGDVIHTTIDWSAVTLNNHCRDDFNDIRFTKSDGSSELDFWTPPSSIVSGVSAEAYMEFDSIPASPDTATFYIYYGKADADSGSNSGNTLPFIDEFPGETIDTTKWNTVGTIVVSGGECQLNEDDVIYGKTKFGYNYEVRARAKADEQDIRFCGWGDSTDLNPPNFVDLSNSDGDYPDDFDRFCCKERKDSGAENRSNECDAVDFRNTYYEYCIQRKSGLLKFFQGNVKLAEHSNATYLPTVDLAPHFITWDGSQASILTLDWVFVRKWVDPEPTWGTWGNQEINIIATTAIGVSASASRPVEISRTALVKIGVKATASRVLEISRTALTKIGLAITASLYIPRIIKILARAGSKYTVTGKAEHKYDVTGEAR